MRDGKASSTAQRVAEFRAAHQLFDAPKIFDDPLALRILGDAKAARLRADPTVLHGPVARALRAGLAARSRFCEDALRAALARGVRQVVILGAGLDTLAYRDILPADAKVFEIDHPATQAWKKERLAEAGILPPPSLAFVPVDFDKATLAEALAAGGIDPARPTFFSWLGVVYYLPPDTVLSTLRFIGRLATGGEIVFDYFESPRKYGLANRLGFAFVAWRVATRGEPWKSFFEPTDIAAELRRFGFEDIEDLDGAAMTARYFAGRSDGLKPGGTVHLVRALIGGEGG